MARLMTHAALLGAATILSACSFSMDSLWPSLTGDNPAPPPPVETAAASPPTAQTRAVEIPPSEGERRGDPTISPASPPALGSTNFVAPQVTPGQSTGTFVSQKVMTLRGELQRMRANIRSQNNELQQIRRQTVEHAQRYHVAIATINSRLQMGTTPGNPRLVNQWNVAQASLGQIDADITRMNSLANSVASNSTMSAYLIETTRAAYGLSGAVEEDHQQLAILEDEVNRTVVLIDRLLNELSEDINRQTGYVAAERSNLTALSLAIKNGDALGSSLVNRTFAPSAPSAPVASTATAPVARTPLPAPSGTRANSSAPRRPLVVIRFDRNNVDYEQALYNAVSRALERRPQAGFDLVAVASGKGSPAQVTVASSKARRNAEKVLRSLSDMGMPLQRVRLSAMTSAEASSNEVHLYIH